jgi:hypothetical protein
MAYSDWEEYRCCGPGTQRDGTPGDEASERTDEAGSIPGAETGSAPVTVGKVSETDGAGGGPDIADTKLLGFLTLPVRVCRL